MIHFHKFSFYLSIFPTFIWSAQMFLLNCRPIYLNTHLTSSFGCLMGFSYYVQIWSLDCFNHLPSVGHVQLFVTPWTVDCQALLSMGFSRQNTRVSCHSLLQEIFPTQGSNLGLLHCMQILYHLSHQGNPKRGEYFGQRTKCHLTKYYLKNILSEYNLTLQIYCSVSEGIINGYSKSRLVTEKTWDSSFSPNSYSRCQLFLSILTQKNL